MTKNEIIYYIEAFRSDSKKSIEFAQEHAIKEPDDAELWRSVEEKFQRDYDLLSLIIKGIYDIEGRKGQ